MHSRIVTLLLLFFCLSCNTRRQEVIGVVRSSSKKKQPVKTTQKAPGTWQDKIGITSGQVKSDPLYAFISEWYGAPYKYGGCLPTGVDCSCFVNILCEKVYDQKLSRTAGAIFKECDPLTADEAKAGDLFFFTIGTTAISHVGVCVKEKYFVHASTSKGVVLSSIDEPYYSKYFFAAGRPKQKLK